jgi:hypothetical protein
MRSLLVCTLAVAGSLCIPPPAMAVDPPGWHRFEPEEPGDFSLWFYGVEEDGPDAAEAVFLLEFDGAPCLSIELEGSAFRFLVNVELGTVSDPANDGITWGDLAACFPEGYFGSPERGDFNLLTWAAWLASSGESLPEISDGFQLFSCLSVSAVENTNDEIEAIVVLAGFDPNYPPMDELEDAWSTYPEGQATFSNVGELGFAVGLDFPEDPEETNLSWRFDINIRECGGYSGPDIDIEHYRRMAEEASALPDTR